MESNGCLDFNKPDLKGFSKEERGIAEKVCYFLKVDGAHHYSESAYDQYFNLIYSAKNWKSGPLVGIFKILRDHKRK